MDNGAGRVTPENLRAASGVRSDVDAGLMVGAADEIERLRYVIGGVRDAIKTGRNEPLQIWLDQINIALEGPKA